MEMMKETEEMQAMSDINVTPFIDVMLVLLIIFMVTAPLMLGGVHVNLPKSGGEKIIQPENPLIVSIDAQHKIYVDNVELSAPNIHEQLKTLALNSVNGEVFVRGDGEIKYSKMIELMGELGQAGFARVTLVTELKQEVKESLR